MARLGGGLLILKHGVSFCLKNEPESILNSRRVVLRFGLNQRLLFDRKQAVERDLVAGHCAHEKLIELAGLAGTNVPAGGGDRIERSRGCGGRW